MLFLPTIKVIREKLRADQIYMYLLLIRAQHAHGKALQKMDESSITSLFAFETDDEKSPIGIIHLHDLLQAGVV